MRFLSCLTLAFLFGIHLASAQTNDTRLLRYPTIYGGQIVFGYAGDLYTVSSNGGTARKLTDHTGYEMFPRFSPDGRQIAFAGQYHGNTEVYIMPRDGGEPKRLTYTATLGRDDIADRMGPNNLPMTWTADGESVVFRTRRFSFNSFKGILQKASVDGGLAEDLPFSVAGWCSYSPEGDQLAYNRVFREFRTWKYYQGGMAGDVWIVDPETGEQENITQNDAQDVFPMWHENSIYYCSDRDGRMNIFKYDIGTKATEKVTDYTAYDVKFPSYNDGKIVFEMGGQLHVLDCKTDDARAIKVYISDDSGVELTQHVSAKKYITDVHLSPDGNRVLVTARGDIWSVPVKSGVVRNLTQTDGVHERDGRWSPKGDGIAFISDASGEFEIHTGDPIETGEGEQITKKADTYKWQIEYSPDGRMMVWSDKKLRLRMMDINSGKITDIAQADAWEYRDYTFSPDNQWIAYTENDRATSNRVYLYNIASGESFPVTDEFYNAGSVSFSDDGQFLLFVSQRDFSPIYSQTEWNHAYRNMSRVYLLPLAKATDSPLMPENQEVAVSENDDDDADDKSEDDASEQDNKSIVVDQAGIIERAIQLPVEPGDYTNLHMIGDKVYYQGKKFNDESWELKYFDLTKRKAESMGEVSGYQLSQDRKKVLYKKGSDYYVEALGAKLSGEQKVDMSNLDKVVDLRAEWEQIFFEAWRQMRDFFYAPNMHGVDWDAMRDKYAKLLPHARHRNDLTYIIGEMIAELNVGHAYISGGDRPKPERIKMGLLGARYSRHESGFFKVDDIIRGANWSKPHRSPLTEPGVEVSEGDYIIAINGKRTDKLAHLNQALIGTADEQTELLVNSEPKAKGAKRTIVVPRKDEADLYYYDWVRSNIEQVNEMSDGRIGYVHVPDMSKAGLNEFVRYFYPQLNREALIIDVRGNGGGNVSPMIIERLNRELAMIQMSRNTSPYANPFQMLVGPKVMLHDRYSASDGDLVNYRFKAYDLGTTIGERSWGGVVGIRGSLPFIDGAGLRKPEFAPYDKTGKKWIIEGYGVDPDIEVVNDPYEEYNGKDAQLERSVEELKKQMEQQPTTVPPIPDFPNRARQPKE